MAETALKTADLYLQINPDSGQILVRLGPVTMTGFCQASVHLPGQHPVAIVGQRAVEADQAESSDVHGQGRRLSIRFADGAYDIGLRLEAIVYAERPFLTLRLTVLNHGLERVQVDSLTPFDTSSLSLGDGPLDGWVNGFHSWSFTGYVPHTQRQPAPATGMFTLPQAANPTTPAPSRAGQYVGEGVAALIDPGQGALVAGFIGLENQFGQVYLDGRPGNKRLTLQTTGDGVPIGSGEVMPGEWAILYRVELPHHDPLGEYARAVTRLTPGRLPEHSPSPGWSSWYQFYDGVTLRDMARSQAVLAMVRDQLPLRVLQLDDGYQPAWGDWLAHNSKFPGGVPTWAKAVRSGGFEPGLWLSPFTVDPASKPFRQHADAVLRNANGRPVWGGFLIKRRLHGLDPTHPWTQDFIRRTIGTIVHRWGVRYLKLDFLYCGALPGLRHDPTRTRAQALRDGLRLIREVAGEDVTLLGCGCPFGPALGIVDIMRVGPDVAPYWYPVLFGLQAPFRHDFNLPSARSSMAISLNRHWTHRRFWWLDADNLMVRKEQELTEDEIQTLVAVLGMTDSHLVLSDDLPAVSARRLRWAACLLPHLPGRTSVAGLFRSTLPGVVKRTIKSPAGPYMAVALINWNDQPNDVSITREELGLPQDKPLLVFDFWNRRIGLAQRDSIRVGPVPPHGVSLLALRPVVPGPQIVGTDLHISMGREITRWEPAGDRLDFSIRLGRQATGSVWLKLPMPPVSATCNGERVSFEPADTRGIYVLHVTVDGSADVSLMFSE